MLHCSMIELAPLIICELLLHGADIQVGAVSPLLGQHGSVMSTLGHLSHHLLQVPNAETHNVLVCITKTLVDVNNCSN